jgi:hypothetical protein
VGLGNFVASADWIVMLVAAAVMAEASVDDALLV